MVCTKKHGKLFSAFADPFDITRCITEGAAFARMQKALRLDGMFLVPPWPTLFCPVSKTPRMVTVHNNLDTPFNDNVLLRLYLLYGREVGSMEVIVRVAQYKWPVPVSAVLWYVPSRRRYDTAPI